VAMTATVANNAGLKKRSLLRVVIDTMEKTVFMGYPNRSGRY
jgi:hypothetical protein